LNFEIETNKQGLWRFFVYKSTSNIQKQTERERQTAAGYNTTSMCVNMAKIVETHRGEGRGEGQRVVGWVWKGVGPFR